MTAEQLHARYLTEIEKRGRDDKYIDGTEERELMQIAIQHGFAPERAREFLTEVCRQKVVQAIREKLQSHTQSGGLLARSSFESVVREATSQVSGTTRTDRDIRRLVVATIEDVGLKCQKTWGLLDWYASAKTKLGMS
jgi:hypothetical protein